MRQPVIKEVYAVLRHPVFKEVYAVMRLPVFKEVYAVLRHPVQIKNVPMIYFLGEPQAQVKQKNNTGSTDRNTYYTGNYSFYPSSRNIILIGDRQAPIGDRHA